MGWIGMMDKVIYTLDILGADKDDEGRFLIYDKEVVTFLGLGDEALIHDDVCYSVNGHKASLAGAMGMTSYGCKVTVI